MKELLEIKNMMTGKKINRWKKYTEAFCFIKKVEKIGKNAQRWKVGEASVG